jgi:hypothetical protein
MHSLQQVAQPWQSACTCPLQVALFQMLTGWAQEDLLDRLAAVKPAGGALMDRLQDGVAGWLQQTRPDRLATCCLIRRNVPARTPPRIVVFCGPGAPWCWWKSGALCSCPQCVAAAVRTATYPLPVILVAERLTENA